MNRDAPPDPDLIGLIPAAGRGSRLLHLPMSKELYPVGFERRDGGVAPKAACTYLLDRMREAGVRRAVFVLRPEKLDVAAYLAGGEERGLDLAYCLLRESGSVPESLLAALPFLAGQRVVFGFPDVLFEPHDAYPRLLEHPLAPQADLLLGLFPTEDTARTDMIDVDEAGRVRGIEVRPPTSRLRFNWLLAIWGPRFTALLSRRTGEILAQGRKGAELQLGSLMQEAVEAGLRVVGLPFPEGAFEDIGTPGELAGVLRRRSRLPSSATDGGADPKPA